jgi:hypothetical protein
MLAPISPTTRTLGFWSALLSTVFSLAYVVGQLAEWLGWLGSAGGSESPSTPLGLAVLLTPSFFLGPAFLILIASVRQWAPPSRRVWTDCALAFATGYAVMTGIVYFVQLTWVAPRLAAGRVESLAPFLFTPFDSFLYAVDILGYSFMSFATLMASQIFVEKGLQRAARISLIANGLIAPFLLLQNYWHWLLWIASAWAITFPAATWSLALLFRRTAPLPESAAAWSRAIDE